MPVEITPEPTPEERRAILEALAASDPKPKGESRWWQEGIAEAVGDELSDEA